MPTNETLPVLMNTIQSIRDIDWRADNLQDIETMETLKDCIEKYGSLAVMRHLENMKNVKRD